jgi:hypothetical protein
MVDTNIYHELCYTKATPTSTVTTSMASDCMPERIVDADRWVFIPAVSSVTHIADLMELADTILADYTKNLDK